MQRTSETPVVTPHASSPKSFIKSRRFEIAFVLLVLAVSTALVAPFYYSRELRAPNGTRVAKLIWTDDLPMHLPIMQEFDRVRRSGILYPRWLPGANNGYGIVTMVFYPPGSYFLCSWLNTITNDWLNTLFIVSLLGLAASGLLLYKLARLFFDKLPCAVAAFLYMLLPFHTYNLYWQGAIPQFLGYAFLPLIVYFAYRVGSEGRLRFCAGLGLFYGLFILTHLPVSYLFTYVLALYAVVWSLKERNWRILLRIAAGMTLGLSLSAIYWLPAALESKYVYEWASELFPYHRSYITLLPATEEFVSLINAIFLIYVIALAAAVLILRLTLFAKGAKSSDRSAETQTRIWTILAIAALFMSTSFSVRISMLIPRIQIAVPANRWLVIAALFIALLTAAAIQQLRNKELSPIRQWAFRAAVSVVLVVSVGCSVRSVMFGALARGNYEMPATFVNSGFTPRGSTTPENLPDTPLAVLEPSNGASEIVEWKPQHRLVAVRVDQPSELRLKTYNFPGWTARVDGQQVPVSSDKDGVQVISIPPGRHEVEADFVDTPPRTIGTGLFFISLAAILGLAVADFRRRTKENAEQGVVAEGIASKLAKHKTKILVAGSLAVAVVIAGLAVTRWLNSETKSSPDAVKGGSPTASTSARGTLAPDSEANLYVAGLSAIPVAVNQQALAELMNALPVGRNDQVDQLVQAGKVFRVDNNTKVRILEIGPARLKVRILEGPNVTLDGWVPDRWIR